MAMTVRLPPELDAALDRLADDEHVSKHALLLQGAELVLASRRRRGVIDEAVDAVLTEDAELLRRLADA